MYASDFEYDGRRLSDFGYTILSFETSYDGTFTSGNSAVFNQIKAASSDLFHLYSSTYEEPFTYTFEIGKRFCDGDQDNMVISPIEESRMQSWLCQKRYRKLKILQSDYEGIYWNGLFTSQHITVNGKVVALELTFYSETPYAYYDEQTLNHQAIAGDNWSVVNNSDETGILYPDWVFSFTDACNKFTVKNSLGTRDMEITDIRASEVITINGKFQTISSTMRTKESIATTFNFAFPALYNTPETNLNVFTFNAACAVTLRYSGVCKVGM